MGFPVGGIGFPPLDRIAFRGAIFYKNKNSLKDYTKYYRLFELLKASGSSLRDNFFFSTKDIYTYQKRDLQNMIINKYKIEPSSVASLLKKSSYKSIYFFFFDHMAEEN